MAEIEERPPYIERDDRLQEMRSGQIGYKIDGDAKKRVCLQVRGGADG